MSNPTVSPSPVLRERLRGLRDTLLSGLVERDVPMRLALLAALAGEHLLLIGLPGTAKSELARRLHRAFRDASYFERLLTRFSVPEELFGPLSIKALENDRYQRLTEGYLPCASIAFLDEIFKANSAILNALLTLLNEREFDNGTTRVKTPLVCVLAASNELPDGEELAALYDRFLLRFEVDPVSEAGFDALLDLRGVAGVVPEELRLTMEDLEAIRGSIEKVSVPGDVREMLKGLRAFLGAERVYVSDRRWRKILRLLQASAFTDGRAEVSIWDAWLLQHCAWERPEQRQAVFEWYEKRVGAANALDPGQFGRLAEVWEATYQRDATSQSQMRDGQGRLLYLSQDGKQTQHVVDPKSRRHKKNAQGAPLYLGRAHRGHDRTNQGNGHTREELRRQWDSHWQFENDVDPYITDSNNWLFEEHQHPAAMEPTRYSKEHIEGRASQVEAIRRDVAAHLRGVEARIKSVTDILAKHLWVGPGFAEVAGRELESNRVAAAHIGERLQRLTSQFRKLPRVQDP